MEMVDAVADVGHLTRGEALVIELGRFNFPVVQATALGKSGG